MARDLEHDSCFWRNGPARGVLCYGLGISICRITYYNFKEYGIGRFRKEYVWDGFSFYVSFGNYGYEIKVCDYKNRIRSWSWKIQLWSWKMERQIENFMKGEKK